MTLAKQLGIIISISFMLIFMGTFIISVNNAREYLSRQLASHAQDTATSLGLSLSAHIKHNDIAAMQSMVDAIFDSGYYKEIVVENIEGKKLVERYNPLKIQNIPNWFVQVIPLQTPRGEALIVDGWVESGKVWLSSHPGYAYQELWRTTTGTLYWFISCAIAALWLGLFMLRFVLKPMRKVEEQAIGICNNIYSMQSEIPNTRELRRVVMAMNKMSAHVKQMFVEQSAVTEKLRSQIYLDSVTEVGNRRYFDAQLEYLTKSVEEFSGGALLLLRLIEFKLFNDKHGYMRGDELLKQIATMIREACKDYGDCMIARISGADFAIIVKQCSPENMEILARQLSDSLLLLRSQGFPEGAEMGCVGGVMFSHGYTASELLADADQALSMALSKGGNAWHAHFSSYPRSLPKGLESWRNFLSDMIRFQQIALNFQPVLLFDSEQASIIHREVLLRLREQSGELIVAGVFLPMAERIGLASEFDRLAIKALLSRMGKQKSLMNIYAVNITPNSISNAPFVDWLCAQLKLFPNEAKQLIFEISEYGILRDIRAAKTFIQRLRSFGARVSIDHFGHGFDSFAYLHSIGATYIKIDGSFIRNINQDEDNQFFVRELTRTAHNIEMKVIALNVETEDEKEMLKVIGVDGIQGYFIGKPSNEI
jgi:diguanylate cyclase (GGDEF)-like protein